ncbi:MAG: pectate lyase [Gemmatimonadaceae bacterium]
MILSSPATVIRARRRSSECVLLCAAIGLSASGSAQTAGAALSASREADTSSLLSAGRLVKLPAAAHAEWDAYLSRSRSSRNTDEALIAAELKQLGQATMVPAPLLKESFDFVPRTMTPEFFRTDSARKMADNMLTFQTPSGGWSKHVSFTEGARKPGQSFFSENDKWQYIATVDNDATTSEIRFLHQASLQHRDKRYENGVLNGVAYLLHAQFPNGCWPQVWPLQGGYHDAATFNDNAIVEVMQLLDDAATGKMTYVPDSLRKQSATAVQRAIQCVLQAQVVVRDTFTVWGQQHDPLTLAATNARSYELTSLTSKESASIVDFLMTHTDADTRIPARVHAAIDWFEHNKILGFRYEQQAGLIADASAPPQWARMSEIGTNTPIFSNRDGIKQYKYDALTDRRIGYGWYADSPNSTLKRYAKWAQTHPRSASTKREQF